MQLINIAKTDFQTKIEAETAELRSRLDRFLKNTVGPYVARLSEIRDNPQHADRQPLNEIAGQFDSTDPQSRISEMINAEIEFAKEFVATELEPRIASWMADRHLAYKSAKQGDDQPQGLLGRFYSNEFQLPVRDLGQSLLVGCMAWVKETESGPFHQALTTAAAKITKDKVRANLVAATMINEALAQAEEGTLKWSASMTLDCQAETERRIALCDAAKKELEENYEEWSIRMARLIYKYTKSEVQAQDCVSEAIIKFLEVLDAGKFRGAAAVKTYLQTAVENTARTQYKTNKTRTSLDSLESDEGEAMDIGDALAVLTGGEASADDYLASQVAEEDDVIKSTAKRLVLEALPRGIAEDLLATAYTAKGTANPNYEEGGRVLNKTRQTFTNHSKKAQQVAKEMYNQFVYKLERMPKHHLSSINDLRLISLEEVMAA